MQLAKVPHAITYSSINQAKENHAFVSQYIPDSPFICISGKEYDIEEGWIAHPYIQHNFYVEIVYGIYTFSLSFKPDNEGLGIFDAHDFIQGIESNDRISFYLTDYNKKPDTIIVHYRQTLKSPKMNKKLLLFRK